MDLRKIKKLIDLLEESNLAEIEIKEGEESVRLSRIPTGVAVAAPAAALEVRSPAAAAPAAAPMPMSSPTESATGGTAKAGADDCDFLCASHGAWSSFSNNGRRRLSARFLKCIRSFF